MSLVDYASSDEGSENEQEVNKKEVEGPNVQNLKPTTSCTTVNENSNCDTNGELFSLLPKPKKTFSLPEDNKLSKLLLNKSSLISGKKESVQISVPSVSEFEDSEQPSAKKIKPSAKGAGLFSILPPPKNAGTNQTNRYLVPHAVSKSLVQKTGLGPKSVNNVLKGGDADEEDDDTPVGNSFFGISLEQQNSCTRSEEIQEQNVLIVEGGSSFNTGQTEASFGEEFSLPELKCNLDSGLNVVDSNPSYMDTAQATDTVTASDNPLKLDEKALQILCGNKKKRHQMPMNIIDLSSEEILPDSKEWLLKQFTEEKRGRSHSHKKSHGPSSQSRRKHQITYLAYQAKEQELELQNQWANNRMSRKQTQSKYGF